MEESHLPQLPQLPLPQVPQVVSPCDGLAPDVADVDDAGDVREGAGDGQTLPSTAQECAEIEENTEVLQSLKLDLDPPAVPSLDEHCHDLDVPSEVPRRDLFGHENEVPFMLREDIVSAQAPMSQVTQSQSTGVETARTLVEQRRVDTALRGLPSGKYGAEGALLRLKCFIQLRKFADAAKECETEELKDSFEAQLFLAQAPYLLRADGFGALRKLQELSEAWRKKGPESMDLRLKLLQVFSQLSLQVGHGHVGLAALQRALDGGDGAKRQLWSLLGRHHLSWGNLNAAKDAFETARSLGPAQEASLFLNEGLLAMAQGDYAHARGFFESATAASDPEEALAAENNLAVCKFYTKDLPGACGRLEALVKQDALRFLKPCLLQNLVSLYEFSQEAALKRQELHALAKTAQLEDLDPQLFKAPM